MRKTLTLVILLTLLVGIAHAITYEDFENDYTEVDIVANRVAVSGNSITTTAVAMNEIVYVYKNFGSNYFSGDLAQTEEFFAQGGIAGSQLSIWALDDATRDWQPCAAGTGNCIDIFYYTPDGLLHQIYLYEFISGSSVSDLSSSVVISTWTYLDITRDDDGGAGSGSMTVDIYSDAAKTTLVDTIAINLQSAVDYDILYGMRSRNLAAGGYALSAIANNLCIADCGTTVASVVGGGIGIGVGVGGEL